MARATGTRSQRQASQSQPPPTQTQNGRSQTQRNNGRRRTEEEEEEEEEEEDADDADDSMSEDDGGEDDDLERKANDLVRLALFAEQKRHPLRRDEISKKVMGSKSRRFGEVFGRAQQILYKTFGMELVELHNRAAEDKEQKPAKKQDKDAVGMKKKAAPTGTKTYILRSKLDPRIIQIAASPDADILRIEQADLAGDEQHVVDDDEANISEPTGAIISWERGDQLQNIGLLYVILSLILVHGRTISDNELRTLLRRLRLTSTSQVPRNSRSVQQSLTVEQFLAMAIRQGYLDRQRVGEAKGGQKKRGRAPAATQGGNNDDAVMFEWRWGPRATAEVGEQDIARFVSEFMVDRTRGDVEVEDDEEGGVQEDPETRKMREGMLRGIERAAGGNLVGLV